MTAAPDIEPNEAELIEALAALERGEAVETILRRRPASADVLRPAVELAARLAAAAQAPTRAQADASRARLLAAFEARGGVATEVGAAAVQLDDADAAGASASPVRPALEVVRPVGGRAVGQARQAATRWSWAAAAGVAALLVGTPVAFASTRAVPGDVLYGVKETGRIAWLALSTDPEGYEMRSAAVAAARRDDIAAALAAGRSGEAVFEGVIEAYATEWCRISGLTVQVPPEVAAYGEAESPGAFGVGDHVRIEVRLVSGRLTATAMHAFLGYGRPAPVVPNMEGTPAEPTPTGTATPGATPRAVGATPAGGRPASATTGAGGGADVVPGAGAGSDGSAEPRRPDGGGGVGDDSDGKGGDADDDEDDDKGVEDGDEGGDDEDVDGDDKGGREGDEGDDEDEDGDDKGGDDKGGDDEDGDDEDEDGDDKGGREGDEGDEG